MLLVKANHFLSLRMKNKSLYVAAEIDHANGGDGESLPTAFAVFLDIMVDQYNESKVIGYNSKLIA